MVQHVCKRCKAAVKLAAARYTNNDKMALTGVTPVRQEDVTRSRRGSLW